MACLAGFSSTVIPVVFRRSKSFQFELRPVLPGASRSLRLWYSKAILSALQEGRVEFFNFDQTYFRRLQDRDPLTESHFFSYFSELLQIKLRSRLRSPQAIEDIKQETFVRVLAAIRSESGIRSPERLGPFVNSVCNNVLMEFYRAQSRAEPAADNPVEPRDPVIDLDGLLVTKQTCDQVRKVLEQLPEKDRRLLRALFLEEKEKDQICNEFRVNRDYLRVLLHRAKQSFRLLYEKGERLPIRRTVPEGC
jgi:RNA polymerase sigma-70 factor, ECF subfamily